MSWTSALGGLLGGASSALSSLMSYKSAKKLQQHQYDLNQRSLLESPSNTRKGYVSAGYNPLLALGSSGEGFSANSAGTPVDVSSGANAGVNSALAVKQNKAQIANINADSALKNQQGETEKARRVQMEFQNAMYDVQKHLADKDLSTYDKRFYMNLYEQMQRAENYKAQSAIGQMNAETNRLNYKVNSANSAINQYNSITNRMNAYSNASNATTNKSRAEYDRNRKSVGALGFSYSFSHRDLY